MPRFWTISKLLFALSLPATAATLSPEAIYRRCYGHLVRARPQPGDATLNRVISGKITAPQACQELIARADLGLDGKVNARDPEALAVLRTFQSLHSSWFSNHSMVQVELEFPTTNLFDSNAMGYHFTNAVLNPRAKFSEVVTSPAGFNGIRESKAEPAYFLDTRADKRFRRLNEARWYADSETPFAPPLVATGPLRGLSSAPASEIKLSAKLGASSVEFDPLKDLGAGALGAPAYILLSTTMKKNTVTDSGLNMHRGWSRAVLGDFLCRSLPVIKPGDVRGVDKKSPVSFRGKAKCMQCHASMDAMAGVLNGVSVVYTSFDAKSFQSRAVAGAPAALPESAIYMRDYSGKLLDIPVHDLAGLGRELAAIDDLYICAAKRYFEFFTGVDVSMSADGDSATAAPYRDFVIRLGLELKKDQSVRNLIGKIFASKFYAASNYATPGYAGIP